MLTNIDQLATAAAPSPAEAHPIHLEGTVLWAQPKNRRIVMLDDTGTAALRVNAAVWRARPGERVQLSGEAIVARRGADVQLGTVGAVVDNDGEHAFIEKVGSVFLPAGLNPIRLEYFNSREGSGLELEFAGPGVPRQPLPATSLWTVEADRSNRVSGLSYKTYEGVWQRLPDFDHLVAVSVGRVAGIDISVLPKAQNAGVVFEGYLAVETSGLYTFFLVSDDGSRFFAGKPTLTIEMLGEFDLPQPLQISGGQVWPDDSNGIWAQVEGRVQRVIRDSNGSLLVLWSGLASLEVEFGDDEVLPAITAPNQRVRVTGFCQPLATPDGQRIVGRFLVPDWSFVEVLGADARPATGSCDELPVLTTAAEVHRLKREEALLAYAVRIRGTVTCVLPEDQGFTIQDNTRGIYVVDLARYRSCPPAVGDYVSVVGSTDPSLFAPIVNASLLESLGLGQMPAPVKPSWDQLMNGSLDAQYVEVEGFVTAAQTNVLSLLTRNGVLMVEVRVPGMEPEEFGQFENALVRIQGCLLANWDYVTHEVSVGNVRIYDAKIILEQPAPVDLFLSPSKTGSELLQFDPQAGAFQRIKVSGQLQAARGMEYFMLANGRGVRFRLMKPGDFKPGDDVEVVGFPELYGGGAPLLHEAVARKIGRRALPEPRSITADELIDANLDSTRVCVTGRLAGVRSGAEQQVLEIQSGVRAFTAVVPSSKPFSDSVPIGSELELTGVYVGHGGVRSASGDLAGFELLVDSPTDIRLLARPPWWTLKRLLVILAILGVVLATTMLWVTQLRRQVEQRSAELALQVKEREQAEHQRAIEQERARIAQDLHDELGSGITEISMLAARAKAPTVTESSRTRYLDEAWSKAREMVTALDEIVWAMDPLHDSLSSLVSYCSLYADRFLGLAGIGWRLEGDLPAPERTIDSRQRYQLLLILKEALNNVVRHANASEVNLKFQLLGTQLSMEVQDNGQGVVNLQPTDEVSGLANMESRIKKMGGQFKLKSRKPSGTCVSIIIPLRDKA